MYGSENVDGFKKTVKKMIEGGKMFEYRDATASYEKLPSARPWERVQCDACFYVMKGRLVLMSQ